MNIEERKIGEIKPYPGNPRRNGQAVAAVAESIQMYGFQQPIVVDSDGVIIVGHTRWKAAKKLRMKAVPVQVADEMTPAQVKAYRIADNKVGELAEWDMPDLMREVSDLALGGIGEIPGVDMEAVLGTVIDELEPDVSITGSPIIGLKNDVLFESRASFDIPELISDRILSLAKTVGTWSGYGVSGESSGQIYFPFGAVWGSCTGRVIAGFYTTDDRFESMWETPSRYIPIWAQRKVEGIIPPNFSLWWDLPQATRIWNVYRQRWLARYFQEAGFLVAPDIAGHPRDLDFCLAGIPRPCKSVSVQAISSGTGTREKLDIKISVLRIAFSRLDPEVVWCVSSPNVYDLLLDRLPEWRDCLVRVRPLREARKLWKECRNGKT